MEGVVHTPSIVAEAYMEDRLAVLCPADGPFRPGQVIPRKRSALSRCCCGSTGSGTRETFERAVGQAGFSVTPTWEAMSNRALLNAVIGGLGICVLSARIAAGDVAGAVGLLTEDRTATPDEAQCKAVSVAAAFLAKQMEE